MANENEEKALELMPTTSGHYEIMDALLNMAAWKDEQFTKEKQSFIDKACDAYCKVCGHFAHTVPADICRHDCIYFSDFRKYMKGENDNE